MYHELAATPGTCQWGYFDNSIKPVLRVGSGDLVKIECLSHHAGDAPDLMFDPGVKKIWDSIPDQERAPGVHIVTGPIAIDGAEPGDALEVRFLQARPRLPYGVNFEANWGMMYAPTRAPMDTPSMADLEGREHVVIYEADWDRGVARGYTQFVYPRSMLTVPGTLLTVEECRRMPFPDVAVPLRPHMGVAAVAPAQPGRINSVPPGRFGGNVDNRNFVPGTTMFYPVQVSDALFWAGDTHFAEGDGEVSGTAIEGHLNVVLQFFLHKRMSISTPILETDTEIMVHGFHENLDEAARISASEMIHEMNRRWGLTHQEAYSLLSVAGDCRVTQVVNGVKGSHFIIPKSLVRNLGKRGPSGVDQ